MYVGAPRSTPACRPSSRAWPPTTPARVRRGRGSLRARELPARPRPAARPRVRESCRPTRPSCSTRRSGCSTSPRTSRRSCWCPTSRAGSRSSADGRPLVLLPCRGGRVRRAGGSTHYLDERPARRDWTLLGCARSARSTAGSTASPPVADTCPRGSVARRRGRVLTQCCLLEDGIAVDGVAAVVPWGASPRAGRGGTRAGRPAGRSWRGRPPDRLPAYAHLWGTAETVRSSTSARRLAALARRARRAGRGPGRLRRSSPEAAAERASPPSAPVELPTSMRSPSRPGARRTRPWA